MAKAITYWGPAPAVTAPDGTVFPLGVSVPGVSDEQADSLLRQNFTLSEAAPVAFSGSPEAPAIQAPTPVVSHVPTAGPEPDVVAPATVLAPSMGV